MQETITHITRMTTMTMTLATATTTTTVMANKTRAEKYQRKWQFLKEKKTNEINGGSLNLLLYFW